MTDYHPLIARAVDGLDKSSGEGRRALYERARTALVTQLRSVDPPLSESEITKERLALEDAIRKVEADAARKARAELREPRPVRRGAAAPRGSTAGAQAARAGTTETEPRGTGGSRSAARGSAAVGARAAVGRTHFNIIEPGRCQGLSRRCQRGAGSWQRDGQGSAIGTRHARLLRAGCFAILSGGRRSEVPEPARAGTRRRRTDRCAFRRAACAKPRAIVSA